MDLAFKALSDPRRREIMRLVWNEELAATAIAEHFTDVSRPAISQHLGVLRKSGLVRERRAGTRRLYCADHRKVLSLREFLDGFWNDSLETLRTLIEQPTTREGATNG
jgi:DNA-binding transcriptional ArsR family regulator